MSETVWRWYSAAGVVATLAFLALPAEGVAQGLVFVAVQLATVVALAVGRRANRPAEPGAWRILLGAQVVYLVAIVPWYLYPVALGRQLPYPSILEPFFWVAYLGWAAFLVILIRRQQKSDPFASLDAVIVAGALSVLAWEVLLEPAVEVRQASLTAQAASIIYPVLLLVLAALAVRMLMLTRVRTVASVLVVAWVVLELAGDVWYSIASANGSFSYGSPWFATWILSYTALGALSLHPGMATMTSEADSYRPARPPRLVALGLSVATPLVVMAFEVGGEGAAEIRWLIAATAVIMALMLVRLAGVLVDLDEEQRTRQLLAHQGAELERLAFVDPLTGLGNRALFQHHLSQALASRVGRTERGVAVLLLDLDRFKAINDTRGHSTGDGVLVEVAERLRTSARAGDTVVRLGGDEFVVVAEEVTLAEAVDMAERIAQALHEPVTVGSREIVATASIGVTLAEPGSDPVKTLQRADLAMYAAKGGRPGSVELFVPELHERAVDRYELESDLRSAVRRGELVLHYQPVVDLPSGSMVGVEALVRWQHPTRGLLSPDRFIAIAEESGAVAEIGLWVLREAVAQVLAWDTVAGNRGLNVAVNLSPRQLVDPDLVGDVKKCLEQTTIDPARVTLEVTESALLEDTEERLAQLQNLKTLGVSLAIDDFGTGYSSLSYLRRLPADILKIDRSFVAGIAREPQEWALASAIVRLATSVGKQTLAEGVERPDQLAHLLALGCRLGQGYLFSRPLPAEQLEALFAQPRLPAAAPVTHVGTINHAGAEPHSERDSRVSRS